MLFRTLLLLPLAGLLFCLLILGITLSLCRRTWLHCPFDGCSSYFVVRAPNDFVPHIYALSLHTVTLDTSNVEPHPGSDG